MTCPKYTLPFLEVMVIRACNLSCTGCTTFSDLKHAGYITWDQGLQELSPWTQRLNIESLGFMGGEPLMNPDIARWITGVRRLLPHSQLRFVTNGLLLDRHWHIFELLRDIENTVLKISYHIKQDKLDSIIERIMNACEWQPIYEHNISRWKDPSRNFRFQISRPTSFLKTFRNNYHDMAPHDNLPKNAFEICVQQRCPLLYKGKIFKCGTLGLTPDLLDRFGHPNHEQWTPYIDNGLSVDCDDREMQDFVKNFGNPHPKCRQCPSKMDTDSFVSHLENVQMK